MWDIMAYLIKLFNRKSWALAGPTPSCGMTLCYIASHWDTDHRVNDPFFSLKYRVCVVCWCSVVRIAKWIDWVSESIGSHQHIGHFRASLSSQSLALELATKSEPGKHKIVTEQNHSGKKTLKTLKNEHSGSANLRQGSCKPNANPTTNSNLYVTWFG